MERDGALDLLPPSYGKFNTDINSPDVEIVVLSSQQYHFV